ncbi:MAG TPA: hypothetical protein VF791_00330 [Pyrinomonadaceae bacterium]
MPDEKDYIDDTNIPSDSVLWRRIPPWHYRYDENVGDKRPSTASFEDDMDGAPMSAYLAEECREPEVALEGHEGFGLVAFTAGFARELGLKIVRQTVPGPPGHVVIVGKKTDSIRKKLKKKSEWVRRPSEDSGEAASG